ncbi:hypothetical protein ACVGV4_00160 [Enterobacter hormaechei]
MAGEKGGIGGSGEYVIEEIFRFLAHCLAALGGSAAASGTGLRTEQ